MAIDTGLGASFTFSGLTGIPIEISAGSQTAETIDVSSLATTGNARKIPGDLKNPGEATITFQFDPTQTFPTVGATAAALTLTWPTQNTAALYVGDAILTSLEFPTLSVGALQTGTATFTYDGNNGPTWTAGT